MAASNATVIVPATINLILSPRFIMNDLYVFLHLPKQRASDIVQLPYNWQRFRLRRTECRAHAPVVKISKLIIHAEEALYERQDHGSTHRSLSSIKLSKRD
jgi:hypothetical protein